MRRVVKIIDYIFQHEYQLAEAYDDSNSMRYLCKEIEPFLVGRLPGISSIREVKNEEYTTLFFPPEFSWKEVAERIILVINPSVIHFHGNHGWYSLYSKFFKENLPSVKLIFSPAGVSCGTTSFFDLIDKIVVNHPLQVSRMNVRPGQENKIVVRRRTADPSIFSPDLYFSTPMNYDYVYVAGFVPVKRIEETMEMIFSSEKKYRLLIIGSFNRSSEYYLKIKKIVDEFNAENPLCFIHLHDFLPQREFVSLLKTCKIFIWPNIKPENPSTTTNRAVVEAMACGIPLLLGERAFRETEYVVEGHNGFTYSSEEDFLQKASKILENLNEFKKNSFNLYTHNFQFDEHFIRFYNELYLS